jgi:hypothetical protein
MRRDSASGLSEAPVAAHSAPPTGQSERRQKRKWLNEKMGEGRDLTLRLHFIDNY